MIRSLAVVLCFLAAPLVALAPLTAQGQSQWVEHRPPGAGYRVEFPRTPTLTSRDIQTAAKGQPAPDGQRFLPSFALLPPRQRARPVTSR